MSLKWDIHSPYPEVGSDRRRPNPQINCQFFGIQSQTQGLSNYRISSRLFFSRFLFSGTRQFQMVVMFAFLSLWLLTSLGFLIIWYKVKTQSIMESLKRFALVSKVSYYLDSSSVLYFRESVTGVISKQRMILLSLRFSILTSLVQGHLKVSRYLSFSSLLHSGQSGTRPSCIISGYLLLSQRVVFSDISSCW